MLTKRYESIDENGGENDNCTGCRNDIPVPVSISSFARGSIVPRRDLDHLIDYTSPVSVTIQRYVSSHLSKRRLAGIYFIHTDLSHLSSSLNSSCKLFRDNF